MQAYPKPILGLSTIRSARFLELYQDYGKELVRAGYTPDVARLHLRSIAHLGFGSSLKASRSSRLTNRPWRRSIGTGRAAGARARHAIAADMFSHAFAPS